MKKRYIVITIIAILIIAVAIVGIHNLVTEQAKNYEIEQIKEYNYFVLKKEDQYGVIDKKGNTIINAEYSQIKIPNPEKPVFICYQGENTKVLNDKKEEILTKFNEIQPIRLKNISSDLMYEKSILTYKKDEKYGLMNLEGKEITKPIYDEISSLLYKEGELLVKQNGKYGVINIKGNILIEIKYDEIKTDEYYTDENRYQQAGYIVSNKTQEGYRYGYFNEKGKQILGTEYNEISRITGMKDKDNYYLICSKNGQYGVNKNEEQVMDNKYQSIQYDANNEVFIVEKSKKYGVTNLEGKVMIPLQYNQIDINGIYLYAQDEQGTTVYNNNGKQINISPNIAIINTENPKYKIKINNKNGTLYGVIDQEEKTIIEEKYNYIGYLYDDYFIASNENGKLGILDDKEAIKVEMQYDSLQKIQDTDLVQATLTENKTTQIYTKTMEKICEMQNASIIVEANYIKVSNEEETKYYSKEGKELKNTDVYSNHKIFVDEKDGKYGFVDHKGNVVVDYKYDKACELNSYGFAAVKKDGKWGAVDEQGEEVVTPTYEIKNQIEPSFIGSYYCVTYAFGESYYTDAN